MDPIACQLAETLADIEARYQSGLITLAEKYRLCASAYFTAWHDMGDRHF
jgi:hypothetical protein